MLSIEFFRESNTITLQGKLDSANVDKAMDVFEKIHDNVTIDMQNLDFISSSGIGILVMTYRKLMENGKQMYLVNLNQHIKKVFEVSLLDTLFNIK